MCWLPSYLSNINNLPISFGGKIQFSTFPSSVHSAFIAELHVSRDWSLGNETNVLRKHIIDSLDLRNYLCHIRQNENIVSPSPQNTEVPDWTRTMTDTLHADKVPGLQECNSLRPPTWPDHHHKERGHRQPRPRSDWAGQCTQMDRGPGCTAGNTCRLLTLTSSRGLDSGYIHILHIQMDSPTVALLN